MLVSLYYSKRDIEAAGLPVANTYFRVSDPILKILSQYLHFNKILSYAICIVKSESTALDHLSLTEGFGYIDYIHH